MRQLAALSIAVLVGVTAACFGFLGIFDSAAPARIDREPPPRRTAVPRAVVLISIDGLAPRVLDAVGPPTLSRLAREGARARLAETVTPSITLPAHTSMLSGLEVSAHGVTWNRYQPWSRAEVRTLYDVCAERALRCALFAGKRKFAHLAEYEPGVERYVYAGDARAVLDAAADWLEATRGDFALVHLAEVDRTGHRDGWDSPAQRQALRELDAALADFVPRAAAVRPLALIVTADHGGEGHNHYRDTPASRRVPWIAWGDGVPAGAELGEVSLVDTAAAVLALLEVDAALGTGRAPFAPR